MPTEQAHPQKPGGPDEIPFSFISKIKEMLKEAKRERAWFYSFKGQIWITPREVSDRLKRTPWSLVGFEWELKKPREYIAELVETANRAMTKMLSAAAMAIDDESYNIGDDP